MQTRSKATTSLYVRNFIFGVEDSLVSTVGLLSGIAIAGVPKKDIFITGIVLIFVEAFSMGVGSFLSEDFTETYIEHNGKQSHTKSISGALIMLLSYFIAGFIPLSPYLLLSIPSAIWVSIALSLLSLFALGSLSAAFFGVNILKNGLKMLLIGGVAITIGSVIGKFVNA